MFRRLLVIITCLLCLISNLVLANDQRAILELRINGVQKDQVSVWLRNGDVLVRDTELQAAGLHELGRSREFVNGAAYVPLSSLAPNLLYIVDDANLSLNLTVNPAVLGHRVETYNNRPPEIVYINRCISICTSRQRWQHTGCQEAERRIGQDRSTFESRAESKTEPL